MNSNAWASRMAIGDRGERITAALIRMRWRDVVNVRRVTSTLEAQRGGDLVVTHKCGRVWSCEVKHDERACETGLLAIETARRAGVAEVSTGLSQTRADAWAFVTCDRLVLSLPNDLRELLARK